MNLGLHGKRAVVLAASRGLGYACALGLAREGCNLVICSRDEGRIEAAAEAIRRVTGARIDAITADVAQADEIRRVVTACVERFGGLEIAVHNAGGPPSGAFATITAEQWAAAFDRNLAGFVWLAQAAVPEMQRSAYGRLIAITSTSIKQPLPDLVLSNATRPGVYGLAKTLAREYGHDGITVNVVAPGRMATERVDEVDRARAEHSGKSFDEVRRAQVANIPLGRLGRPEELANAVVFLASEAASYISGAAIFVDGAITQAL